MLDAYEFHVDGRVYGLYSDQVDLRALGRVRAERGSHVEWDDDAQAWYATIVGARERLGPFLVRSEAVTMERAVMAARLGAYAEARRAAARCAAFTSPMGPRISEARPR